MARENAYTSEDLRIMQDWSLERKTSVTQTRIMEWYIKYENRCYVSFSGGKDSTVLADMTARVCKTLGCPLVLWFSDTGLEFPELKKHVKDFAEYCKDTYEIEVKLIIDYPKDKNGKRISFKDVVFSEGYPIISKTVSRQVHDVQTLGNDCWAARCFDGRETGIYKMNKWKFLIDAPFKISNKCCDIMKKRPAHKFTKESGLVPIIGTMAAESKQRRNDWLKNGCNAFGGKSPESKPMSFWTEHDVLEYIIQYDIPIPSVYGEIIGKVNDSDDILTTNELKNMPDLSGVKLETTGYSRTGCMFCGFGCHLEKSPNRFQRLKETHPKVWEYCMRPISENGLGLGEVLDYIGIEYGKTKQNDCEVSL